MLQFRKGQSQNKNFNFRKEDEDYSKMGLFLKKKLNKKVYVLSSLFVKFRQKLVSLNKT